MINLIKETFQKMAKNKKEQGQEEEQEKIELKNKEKNNDIFKIINSILKQGDSIFTFSQPKIFSLAQENNIAQKYNEEIIVTKDKNLCIGFKLYGYSYAAISPNEEILLCEARNNFYNKLSEDLEINIVCKKEKIILNYSLTKTENAFANEIINKWENCREAYQIIYYIFISTKTKAILGSLNKFKDKLTKETETETETETENDTEYPTIHIDKIQKKPTNAYGLKQKEDLLNKVKIDLKNNLSKFKPSILSADETINFFATYANMTKTDLKYSYELLTDSYITSNVEFKKDYMIFYTNEYDEITKKPKIIYARFISVKAYETENISSLISTAILRENEEYSVFIHAHPYNKQKALKKIKDTAIFAVDKAKVLLENLANDISSDREKLMEVSYSILLHDTSLENLELKTNTIKGVLENQQLAIVKENINLLPLYFSFYPSRSNLNARLRNIQSTNLATMINFENDILGLKSTKWGNSPITIFKHLSGSPYFFNFHRSQSQSANGHTIIIGDSECGKTTLMQFLICNLMKYNINIFAMDKLNGMYNFTNYVNGEYHDLEIKGQFKLNPFSLPKTEENKNFLRGFLCLMANINQNDIAEINNINDTLKRVLELAENPKLQDFYESLEKKDDEDQKDLQLTIKPYLESIFNNDEDALNFDKKLSVLNMDSIIKDETLGALTAIYIFHKLKNISKNTNKGFFIFIDELKDYLGNETMQKHILEAILEIRKINGVITMAVQNISFFKNIPNGKSSFLSNMANFLIYPTNNEESLADMKDLLNLTGSEISFLANTQPTERKILFKSGDSSAILNVDLSALGNHLRVFSSESADTTLLKELKKIYGEKEWRELYLRNQKPKSL